MGKLMNMELKEEWYMKGTLITLHLSKITRGKNVISVINSILS